MKSYLDIIYDKDRKIYSDYDKKFINYLSENFFKGPGKILDIGCGPKRTMKLFYENGYEVYGADIEKFQESDEEKYEVRYSNFENEKLNYNNDYFDFIFCKSVIEHLHNTKNIFNEAFRVLKPGGSIIMLTPSWRHTYWGPFYIDSTHVTPFTEASLHDSFLLSNFKNVEVNIFYQFPLIWKLNFLKYFCKFISIFPFPYFPLHFKKKIYPDFINTLIRFSNEPMLFGYAKK